METPPSPPLSQQLQGSALWWFHLTQDPWCPLYSPTKQEQAKSASSEEEGGAREDTLLQKPLLPSATQSTAGVKGPWEVQKCPRRRNT